MKRVLCFVSVFVCALSLVAFAEFWVDIDPGNDYYPKGTTSELYGFSVLSSADEEVSTTKVTYTVSISKDDANTYGPREQTSNQKRVSFSGEGRYKLSVSAKGKAMQKQADGTKVEVDFTAPASSVTATVFSVKISAPTDKQYVLKDGTLTISAETTPANLNGKYFWGVATGKHNCGVYSANGTDSYNPTIVPKFSGEGCVYPSVRFQISGKESTSNDGPRILVYVAKPIDTASVVLGKTTPTSSGKKGKFTPGEDHSADCKYYFDVSDKKWHAYLTKFTASGGVENVPVWGIRTGEIQPYVKATSTNVTEANYKKVIADFADYNSNPEKGGAGPIYHLTSATKEHEDAHKNIDWLVTTVKNNLSYIEAQIASVTFSETLFCKSTEFDKGKGVSSAISACVAKIDRDKFTKVWNDDIAPHDAPGDSKATGYIAGQKNLDLFVEKQIKPLAQNPDRIIDTSDAWGAPTNPTLGFVGNAAILSWEDNCIVETGYVISKSDAAIGGFISLTETAANVTTYSDTSVIKGHTYTYKICAKTGVDNTPSVKVGPKTNN